MFLHIIYYKASIILCIYYIYILVVLLSKRTMTEKLPLPRSQLQRSLQLFPFCRASSDLPIFKNFLMCSKSIWLRQTWQLMAASVKKIPGLRGNLFLVVVPKQQPKKKKHGSLKSQKPRYHKYLATTIQQKADDFSHNLAGSWC